MAKQALSCTPWLLPGILLCFPFCPPLSGQHVTELPGVLHCGLQSFQFTVNLSLEAENPGLTAWDSQGLPHSLKNDSDCGTWVTDSPDGSLVLEATYNGCYVTLRGFHYVMEVGMQEVDVAGRMAGARKRLLQCPLDLPSKSRKHSGPGLQRGESAGLLRWSGCSGVQSSAPETLSPEVCSPVPVKERLPCAPSPISPGDCDQLGCCYSSEEEEAGSCYYGNTVTSQCTRDGHFSIAVSRNVTSPPLRLDSLHLAFRSDSGCDPVMATSTFVLFQFPFTSCGTTRQISGDQVVYENELVATQDVRAWGSGSITRDSIFRLRVSCSYSVLSNTSPINMQVLTLPPPLPKTQPGPLSLELQIAKEQCWATPGPKPSHQTQWPILVKGCPYAGDNYRTKRIAVPKASTPFPFHHQRFSISTFSFTNAVREEHTLGDQVYLHCSALVCQPAGTPACMVICPASRSSPMDSPALWMVGLSVVTIIIGFLLVFYLVIRKMR
ncbi:hypothetical protein U0070_022591 [Myodes glareolus]|uniref:Zona pellucida sperm-binding protein 4 n=1 Tax=Myodes glareolus TaxID=447135 RepID=A0AAW0J075_MYOGA